MMNPIHKDTIYVIQYANEVMFPLAQNILSKVFNNFEVYGEFYFDDLLNTLENTWTPSAEVFIKKVLVIGELEQRLRCINLLKDHAVDLKILAEALEGTADKERQTIEEAMDVVRARHPGNAGAISFADDGGGLSLSAEAGGLSVEPSDA